ncbi:AraC family transcriptional regulator [Pedobacter frigoris]|uniref:AraC family transcriptional regulator n=1 Tax=Pedobacter frigoris TaxID=2571272 RepID=A0A4U1CMI1_9SPHI|nr:AraC family transcriptional regulator [Pedobacter frigoris]TKC08603.1 AraC family transcriptional regulator [Pedobacter frigoris]
MKAIKTSILEEYENKIYTTKIVNRPTFSTDFHFHEECQLVYVIESEGKRIVGDSVEHFESGELIFLGPNIPHVWHNEKGRLPKDITEINARSISLFFNPQRLNDLLTQFGDFKKFEEIIVKACRGIKFHGETKTDLIDLVYKIAEEKEDFSKMILLINILKILSKTSEYEFLATSGYVNNYKLKDRDRMDKVFKYVFDNFSTEMNLETVSNLIGMNKQAFCRFFKERTQKTFIEFVNEVKIAQACKLIANKDMLIGNVALECGFYTISNFNKFFKLMMGITPRQYRQQLL